MPVGCASPQHQQPAPQTWLVVGASAVAIGGASAVLAGLSLRAAPVALSGWSAFAAGVLAASCAGTAWYSARRVRAVLAAVAEQARSAEARETALREELARQESRIQNAQATDRRLAAHLENTPLAVVDWSPDFRVLSWNAAAEAIFGWSAAEVIGRPGTFLVPPHERAGVEEVWAELNTGRGGHRNYNQNITRDGRLIDCEWYSTLIKGVDGTEGAVSSLALDVTDRLSAERLFRESEERFYKTFRRAPTPQAITRLRDGRILDVNDRWVSTYGYTREEAVGATALELGIWRQPAERVRFMALLDRHGEVFDHEVELHTREGLGRTMLVSATLVTLGAEPSILISASDVSERKAAAEALRASRRFLSTVISQLPGMVYRCRNDTSWTMLFVSDGAKALFGYTPAELERNAHVSLAELIHPEDRARVQREVQARLAGPDGPHGRSYELEYRIIRRDGVIRMVWEHGESQPADQDDHGCVTLIGFITDITPRRLAEDSVRALAALLERRVAERTTELALANGKLKELDRLKSEFLATMSHELRTPLNAILGFSSLLGKHLAGPLNPEQQRQIDMVHSSARHLLGLINDLLDLSRIESGRIELRHETIDLREVLHEVEQTLRPLFTPRGLAYSTQVPVGFPPMLTDRKRLFQIVLNLANNAVKFTDRGEVRVEAAFTVTAVTIAVHDTGIGIANENLPLLFEAFRQVDGSARRVYEGTGLGLHLVKKLLELLGGEVAVQSTRGEGSCFTVTLPLIAPMPAPRTPRAVFAAPRSNLSS